MVTVSVLSVVCDKLVAVMVTSVSLDPCGIVRPGNGRAAQAIIDRPRLGHGDIPDKTNRGGVCPADSPCQNWRCGEQDARMRIIVIKRQPRRLNLRAVHHAAADI